MRFEPFSKLMSENTKNGIYKSKDFMGTGTPIVKMSQQFGNRFIDSYLDGYEQIILDDKELEGYRLLENDLLFSRTSVVPEGVGMCSIIREKERDLVFESNIIRVRLNNDLVNPEFVFRYFQSPQGRGSVLSIAGGTNIKTIKASSLKDLKIPLLDRDAQNNVVEMLRNYDDLIENNRRRIQLLEESARLLYQEWFVHLRFPGHEQVEITDGVPEGWDKTTADKVMDVLSGGTPKTKVPEFWDGEIPFFTPKDAKGLFTYDTEKTITDLGLSKCNSRLYPKYTVFITARGTVGKLSFAQRPMAMNQSCYALIAKGEISQEFLYSSLKASIEQFKARASGAVFDAIVVDTFKNIPFLIPSSSLRDEFTEQVKGVFSQIDNLSIQNMKLAQARDLLLPKLMSGELTV